MESKVNYTVVGIFVVALGMAMIIFFFWLSMLKQGKSYDTYLVFVREDVTGLTEQSPVRFNGVPVGVVESIGLDPKNPQLVRLRLQIERGTPVTEGTIASLQFQGITGVLYVGLKTKVVGAAPLKKMPGEKYPVIRYQPSLIVQLSEVLPELEKTVEDIGDRLGKLLSDENQQSIRNTLKNISTASQDLPTTMKRVNKTLLSVNQSLKQFGNASQKVGAMASDGQLAVRNFSNQLLPSLQQTLGQFNQVTSNLKQITNQLKQNPSVLIRGSEPPPRGPGE